MLIVTGNREVLAFIVSDDNELEVLHRLHPVDQTAQQRQSAELAKPPGKRLTQQGSSQGLQCCRHPGS